MNRSRPYRSSGARAPSGTRPDRNRFGGSLPRWAARSGRSPCVRRVPPGGDPGGDGGTAPPWSGTGPAGPRDRNTQPRAGQAVRSRSPAPDRRTGRAGPRRGQGGRHGPRAGVARTARPVHQGRPLPGDGERGARTPAGAAPGRPDSGRRTRRTPRRQDPERAAGHRRPRRRGSASRSAGTRPLHGQQRRPAPGEAGPMRTRKRHGRETVPRGPPAGRVTGGQRRGPAGPAGRVARTAGPCVRTQQPGRAPRVIRMPRRLRPFGPASLGGGVRRGAARRVRRLPGRPVQR